MYPSTYFVSGPKKRNSCIERKASGVDICKNSFFNQEHFEKKPGGHTVPCLYFFVISSYRTISFNFVAFYKVSNFNSLTF